MERVAGFRGRGEWVERGEFNGGLRAVSVQGRFEQPQPWPLCGGSDWLDLCLNFNGRGRIEAGGSENFLDAGMIWVRRPMDGTVTLWRGSKTLHRFVHLWISRAFFERWSSPEDGSLKGWVDKWWDGPTVGLRGEAFSPWICPIPSAFLGWQTRLLNPPVPEALKSMWLEGKAMELFSTLMASRASPKPLFCERHRHEVRERIDRVRSSLERDLENPPSLEMLAGEVDWSPFHLSRQFKRETVSRCHSICGAYGWNGRRPCWRRANVM